MGGSLACGTENQAREYATFVDNLSSCYSGNLGKFGVSNVLSFYGRPVKCEF